MKNFIICGTKGGIGKSIAATMAVPVVFGDKVGTIKVYHIDDNNSYAFDSERIELNSLKRKDVSEAIDEIELASILMNNEVNIVDSGGGDDTIALLNAIKQTKVFGLKYIIPIMDDIEQVYNLDNTIKRILQASPDSKIYVMLNRVNDTSQSAVEKQFIGVFGSKRYDIESYVEKMQYTNVTFVLLRSTPIFSILKNIYNTTLLDAFQNANELLENLEHKKKTWVKLGKKDFIRKNTEVRLAHEVISLVAEIRDLMSPLAQDLDRKNA